MVRATSKEALYKNVIGSPRTVEEQVKYSYSESQLYTKGSKIGASRRSATTNQKVHLYCQVRQVWTAKPTEDETVPEYDCPASGSISLEIPLDRNVTLQDIQQLLNDAVSHWFTQNEEILTSFSRGIIKQLG
jgi:hypothetical protein